jgi:hypothetical protein
VELGGDRSPLIGWRFILRTPLLRAIATLLLVEALFTAAVLDMFTFHVKRTLAQSDKSVGVVFAVASIGAVLGATVLPAAKRWLGMRVLYVWTAVLGVVAFGAAPAARSVAVTALLAVAFTMGTTMRGILSMSTRQHVTPDPLLGRVTAAFWLSLAAARAIGAGMMGRIAQVWGNDTAFRLISLGFVALAVIAIRYRTLDEKT